MNFQFARTRLLLGSEAMERLSGARVAVFGIGGVGGYVCEALARGGIGAIDLVDNDTVSETNLNRQLIALHSTIGRPKTEVMRERILDINPQAKVTVHNCFFLPETADSFCFSEYDYVVDAIDTVAAKLALIEACHKAGTPIICSMGTGNKLDPGAFQVADIAKTKMDPLARVMRKELGKRGIKHLKVVYSEEDPLSPITEGLSEAELAELAPQASRRSTPGSISFVPPAAGLMLAGEVIRDLAGVHLEGR